MSAVLLERRKPTIKKATTDPVARLGALRKEIAGVMAELRKVETYRRRCEAKAGGLDEKASAVTAARAALEAIHTRKAAGENLRNWELKRAEEALQAAQQDAERAGPAAAGIRTAVAGFADQVSTLQDKLEELSKKARLLQSGILNAGGEASRRQLRAAYEAQTLPALVEHLADAQARASVAAEVGLPEPEVRYGSWGLEGSTGKAVFRLPTTHAPGEPHGGNFWDFELGPEMERRAAEIKARLLAELKLEV